MTAHLKKILVGIVGTIVVLIGLALIVLPGPAFLVIPAGLAILATEFEWAKRWRDHCKDWVHQQREKHKEKKRQRKQAYST
ncbi:MAG TPA: PGPGW domain-containing protein [Verrucomicrobiae bacterium]